MPSFDDTFRDSLRSSRIVNRNRIPDSPSNWEIATMLRVCQEDLAEEERRLAIALEQVKTSRHYIRLLKKDLNRISARAALLRVETA